MAEESVSVKTQTTFQDYTSHHKMGRSYQRNTACGKSVVYSVDEGNALHRNVAIDSRDVAVKNAVTTLRRHLGGPRP